jgi:hypothetical protein
VLSFDKSRGPMFGLRVVVGSLQIRSGRCCIEVEIILVHVAPSFPSLPISSSKRPGGLDHVPSRRQEQGIDGASAVTCPAARLLPGCRTDYLHGRGVELAFHLLLRSAEFVSAMAHSVSNGRALYLTLLDGQRARWRSIRRSLRPCVSHSRAGISRT